MKEEIRGRARELGFDDCRFTTAERPVFGAKFQQWLEEGFHGRMEYLARNAEKRRDPEKVLAGAKSVISLATSYYGGEESEPEAREGVVARYARYADYHKVIGERLEKLTEFINGLTEVRARSLWYVDTGPILERDFAQRAGLGYRTGDPVLLSQR